MPYLVANGNSMNLRRPIRYIYIERDIDFKILSRLNLQKMIEIRPNRMKLWLWFTTRMQQKKVISLLYMVNTLNLFAQYFPCRLHQLLQFSHWIGKWTFNWYYFVVKRQVFEYNLLNDSMYFHSTSPILFELIHTFGESTHSITYNSSTKHSSGVRKSVCVPKTNTFGNSHWSSPFNCEMTPNKSIKWIPHSSSVYGK